MVEANPESSLPLDEEPWIGIDLGTTYTAAGLWNIGMERIDTLQNWEDGKGTTPSIVGYQPKGDILIGNPAKRKQLVHPKNTIYDAKRLIGR